MNPSVSIITVCKNAREDLCKTRDSVFSQNFRNFEWIIIDGKSEDGTKDILEPLDQDWINWISEPDDGIYDAMNKGLSRAIGNRVWFLNAGDTFFDPKSLDLIANVSDSVDICYGEVGVTGIDDELLGLRSQVTPHQLPDKLNKNMFKRGMVVSHQGFVPLRSIVPEFRSNSFRFSADIDWMLRIFDIPRCSENVGTIAIIQRHGATMLNWKKSQWERFLILSNHFGIIQTILDHIYILFRRLGHGVTKNFWR